MPTYVLLIKSPLVIIRNYPWQVLIDALYFEERILAYEQTIPSCSSDARFYGLLNTLGSSKTYIDDQRKLNTLRHP